MFIPLAIVADTAPDVARALLDAAAETGNPAEIGAVSRAAQKIFPDDADAIADYAAALASQAAADADADAPVAVADANPAAEPVETAETEDKDDKPKTGGVFALAPWDGDVAFSAVSATGNSENAALGFNFEGQREGGGLKHTVNAFADFGVASDELNQKRWGASYQGDVEFSPRGYAFGRVEYEEDEFSGFDYRLFFGAGAGYKILKNDAVQWQVDAGPGYRISPIDDTREVDRNVAVRGASAFDWTIRKGVRFDHDARVIWTDPTTTFQSTLGITTELVGGLTTGASFLYRFETNPPAGNERVDTIVRANIGYAF
ncbi:MAG: YdiY family protein [Parvularculaceae bacterium]